MQIQRTVEEDQIQGVREPQDNQIRREVEMQNELDRQEDLEMQQDLDIDQDLEMPLNMEVPQAVDIEMEEDIGDSRANYENNQEVPEPVEVYRNETSADSILVPDVLSSNHSEPLLNPSQRTNLTSTQSESQLINGVEVHSIPSSQRKCCVCKEDSDRQTIPKTVIIST